MLRLVSLIFLVGCLGNSKINVGDVSSASVTRIDSISETYSNDCLIVKHFKPLGKTTREVRYFFDPDWQNLQVITEFLNSTKDSLIAEYINEYYFYDDKVMKTSSHKNAYGGGKTFRNLLFLW